jgi:DNA-binding LytR/AlgR family response regulator
VLKIGICDDEQPMCEQLSAMIYNWGDEQKTDLSITSWNNAKQFCEAQASPNDLDVLFLDIEMRGHSGIEVSHYIREIEGNRSMGIVFISHHKEYALKLFEFQPLHFLVKPITQQQINRVLHIYICSNKVQKGFFQYQKNRLTYYHTYKDIIYFTSLNRKIKIKFNEGEDEFYGKLSSLVRDLPTDFLQIHKSFLVNLNCIRLFGYETVTLFDGTILNISKPYRRTVRSKMLKWGKSRNDDYF